MLCLAAGGMAVHLAISTFTLAWTHTVERIPWEEHWRVAGDRLVLEQVRIKGSGAGMEPPPEARLVDGWYVWQPQGEARPEIVLRRAPQAGDWWICTADAGCRDLGSILGADADPVRIYPCS